MKRTTLVFGMFFVAGAILVSSEITQKNENYYLKPLTGLTNHVTEKLSKRGGQIHKRDGEYNDETTDYQSLWESYYDAYPGSI